MISPFVRRLRLAAEVVRLRDEHGYSAHQLAEQIEISKTSLSRLENGRVSPDLGVIMKILELFHVNEQRWEQIIGIARDAQARGWWTRHTDQMGVRQALHADLETGAATIREYQLTLLPGVLQTTTYTEARLRADPDTHPPQFDPIHALRARETRQRLVLRDDGPAYHVILDEIAVRRHAVPPHIAGAQLDHIIHLGHDQTNVVVQVLSVTAVIAKVPRSAFVIYSYHDPDDPVVTTVDTITKDHVLTDVEHSEQVRRYLALWEHLQHAALSPSDSLDFLIRLAEKIAHQTGR